MLENDSDILFNVFNEFILNANGVIYNNLKNVFRSIIIIQFNLVTLRFQLMKRWMIYFDKANLISNTVIVLGCHLLVHYKIKKGFKCIALMIKTYN